VTIALPLDQILTNIKAVANDLTFSPMGSIMGAPTFRVDGVMIGGL
jgi:predicted Zn-dependent protease